MPPLARLPLTDQTDLELGPEKNSGRLNGAWAIPTNADQLAGPAGGR